ASVKAPSAAAATSIQPWVTRRKRRRSSMSASAPAGSPTKNTGRLVAACTSATMVGDGASEGMSQAPPTLCMHVPMFDTTVAIHRARKIGLRRGLQGEATADLWAGKAAGARTAPVRVKELLIRKFHNLSWFRKLRRDLLPGKPLLRFSSG